MDEVKILPDLRPDAATVSRDGRVLIRLLRPQPLPVQAPRAADEAWLPIRQADRLLEAGLAVLL